MRTEDRPDQRSDSRWILAMALIWCAVAAITIKLIEWSIK